MARDFAKAFYNSKEWQHCRDAYIEHVHGLCERCHRPGWIVHHKCYLTPANIEDPDGVFMPGLPQSGARQHGSQTCQRWIIF